jgi:hypothetical protein
LYLKSPTSSSRPTSLKLPKGGPGHESSIALNSTIDSNRKQTDSLKEKLSMKITALNAIKSNSFQQEDSKVIAFAKL